jgi:hypothetical protein
MATNDDALSSASLRWGIEEVVEELGPGGLEHRELDVLAKIDPLDQVLERGRAPRRGELFG